MFLKTNSHFSDYCYKILIKLIIVIFNTLNKHLKSKDQKVFKEKRYWGGGKINDIILSSMRCVCPLIFILGNKNFERSKKAAPKDGLIHEICTRKLKESAI
ncbi:hypothetical protein ACH52_1806 [Eubacterium limosum]|nr:hypothetical protein ACH52_1806 [Eubacterium limosum]